MALFEIRWRESVYRDLKRISPPDIPRILDRVEALADNPTPQQSRPLHGNTADRRLRIGDYRVLYAIDFSSRSISILAIGHRRDIYR
jgi:mRNA interferase RelE/StbE